jgi:hypothetical protein
MLTIKEMLLIALAVTGVLFMAGSLIFGLVAGKVFAPPGLIEMAASKERRGWFLKREEAPVRFWYVMTTYAIVTAGVAFLVAVYMLHPETFIW